MATTGSDPAAVVERLVAATNAHDLDTIVDCFADDYRNETPAHPERGFTGREQVRRNWTQILGAIPEDEFISESLSGIAGGASAAQDGDHPAH